MGANVRAAISTSNKAPSLLSVRCFNGGHLSICRTLSTLMKSGVPMTSALETKGVVGNKVLAEVIESAQESVMKGGLADPSAKAVVPPLMVRMNGIGNEPVKWNKCYF